MHVLVNALRSSRFVVSAEVSSTRRKIFQVQFSPGDGSVFVHFPYYRHKAGIVCVGTLQPGHASSTIQLSSQGKATSHAVKYSHHPDGQALFSQTGKVVSSVRRQASPLREVDGHLFTVLVKGPQYFDAAGEKDEEDRRPNRKRTVLSFSFGDEEHSTLKFVGRLQSAASLAYEVRNGTVGPRCQLVLANGKVVPEFLCSPPPGRPGEDLCLFLSCEPVELAEDGEETYMVFLGGFDQRHLVRDLSKPTQLLIFSYPASNLSELSQRVGSIDFTGSSLNAQGERREPRE